LIDSMSKNRDISSLKPVSYKKVMIQTLKR
jgi:hypothetical protein